MARTDHDLSQGRHALALCTSEPSQLRSVLWAWKPGGSWGAWEVSRLPLQMKGWWRTPSLLPAQKNIVLCHMALKFKVTWTPHTIKIEEKLNSDKFTQRVVFGFCGQNALSLHLFHTCGKFLTFSSHWNLLTRTTWYVSSHNPRKGKGFLTFPQPIFNFLTFYMCEIGYNEFPHIFPHTRPSWKIKRKIPYIFPMCGISTNALFLTSIPHMRKIRHFLRTFSSHLPHIEIS